MRESGSYYDMSEASNQRSSGSKNPLGCFFFLCIIVGIWYYLPSGFFNDLTNTGFGSDDPPLTTDEGNQNITPENNSDNNDITGVDADYESIPEGDNGNVSNEGNTGGTSSSNSDERAAEATPPASNPHPINAHDYNSYEDAIRASMNDLGCVSTDIEFYEEAIRPGETYKAGYVQPMFWHDHNDDMLGLSTENKVWINSEQEFEFVPKTAAHECLHLRQFELYAEDLEEELYPVYSGSEGINDGFEDVDIPSAEQQVDCATIILGYPAEDNSYTSNCDGERLDEAQKLVDFARSTDLPDVDELEFSNSGYDFSGYYEVEY